MCVCVCIQRGNKGILLKLEVYLVGEFSCLVGRGTVTECHPQGPWGLEEGCPCGLLEHQERQHRAPHIFLQPKIYRVGKGQPGSPSEERRAVLAHVQQQQGSGQGGKAAFTLFARGSCVRCAPHAWHLAAAGSQHCLRTGWAVWGLGCLGSGLLGSELFGVCTVWGRAVLVQPRSALLHPRPPALLVWLQHASPQGLCD